jgi:hypothetical protein
MEHQQVAVAVAVVRRWLAERQEPRRQVVVLVEPIQLLQA